jgi:simple sugar transport system ATP-binding protein
MPEPKIGRTNGLIKLGGNCMGAPILEMKHVTKTFPNCIANDDVNISIYPGEIHALLGENGAGKSTLMNVLTGIYSPDEGTILYNTKPYEMKGPKDAVKIGIGMVHQHFRLVEPLSVSENVFLGTSECKTILDRKAMQKRVAHFSEEFGLDVDPKAKVWQLSVGERQRVEIIKLLFRGTETLILDEPTAILTPQESDNLFHVLQRMASSGKAIIFITHKMNEVMKYAERITVLRGGKTIASVMKKDTNVKELTRMMVGHELAEVKNTSEVHRGECILKIKSLSALNDKGLIALDGIDLDIHGGEILGIAGVAGNGQRELAEAIVGLRQTTSGDIWLDGEAITHKSVKHIMKKGVAFIPEDRLGMGLVPNLNMVNNLILRNYDDKTNSNKGFIKSRDISKRIDVLVEQYDIKNAGITKPIKLMSGGNQQKLLLAREICGTPKLIIASYASRGLDIGATMMIHKILLEQREKGVAVMLISEDLDEIFSMADRIGVLFKGRISHTVETSSATYENIGYLMAGVEQGQEA